MRFLVIVTGLVLLAVAPGCSSRSSEGAAGPRAAREGEEWGHKELMSYLVGKGLELEGYKTRSGAANGPAQWWISASDEKARSVAKRDDAQTCRQCPTIVHVQRFESAEKAKEQVDGAGEFSWGRFAFQGGGDLAQQIKAALPN